VGNSFFAYLEQVELMAFFSGYPLFYAFIRVIALNLARRGEIKSRFVVHLPHAYALVAALYLGLQLKSLFPDYSFERMHLPYLKAWGVAAVLFWLPAMAKHPVLSLLHSLVFFFFIVRDLFVESFASAGNSPLVKNDMKLFSVSLLLNLAAFVAILAISYLIRRFLRLKKSPVE